MLNADLKTVPALHPGPTSIAVTIRLQRQCITDRTRGRTELVRGLKSCSVSKSYSLGLVGTGTDGEPSRSSESAESKGGFNHNDIYGLEQL